MNDTATIIIEWDENGKLDFHASKTIPDKVLLTVGAGLYVAALKALRRKLGDRWAGGAWRELKTLVENKVFAYKARTPRRMRGKEH